MARTKKEEEKPKDSGSLQISVEDFVRTRNSVVTGLATLQSAVSDLSRAYIAHTDTVIGRGNSTSLEQLNISNPLSGDNALFQARGPTPAPTIEAPVEGKKRKRAPHDKNAPKRALTPFFLFLQTARSKIAEEMGDGKTAKEVQDEGGRRWREMTDDDKSKWQYKYAVNFARYREQTKAYKAGQPIPQISDAEATKLYENTKKDGALPKPADLDPGHGEEEDGTDSSEDTSSDESPEPIKPPPAKRSKKEEKKSAKSTPAKEPEPVIPERHSKSPEKKKKKGSKKEAKAVESEAEKEVVAEATSAPQEKPKTKGRKRKSAAADA
ncbi:transcriptional regulator HMO1, partial [Lecanoromycetidae sp. Uapishka_2]